MSEHRENCYSNALSLLIDSYNHGVISEELTNSIPELVRYHADKSKKVVLINLHLLFYKYRLITIWERHKLASIPIIVAKLMRKILGRMKKVIGRKGRT